MEDYSNICNKDDDDITNPCRICINFCFPIGCMINETTDGHEFDDIIVNGWKDD
jgi:hypothetical protein